jgi:DnaK suppressor protein
MKKNTSQTISDTALKTSIDTDHFKKLLKEEYKEVEGELKSVGRRNPEHPSEWEATSKASEENMADDNLVADSMDTYESNVMILKELETRFNEIKKALEHIEQGTYGVCEKCHKPIELERLEANPAAATCEAHLEN